MKNQNSKVSMDIDSYLKNHLNKEGQIKNKDLKELTTQLKSKILSKLQDKKFNRQDNLKKYFMIHSKSWVGRRNKY